MSTRVIAACYEAVAAPRTAIAGGTGWLSLRALLGVKGFVELCAGNGLALSGIRLQSIVVAWLVLEMTGSKMMLGVVVGAPAIAAIAASLLGGVLADSSHARAAIKWTRLAMASSTFLTGLLVTTGHVEIAILLAAVLVTSFATAVDMPVGRTLIFEMVGRERLLSGTAMSSMAQNLCTMGGPMIVGLLMGHFGAGAALFALAGAYVLAASLVPVTGATAVARRELSPVQELRAGFAYLRETPCVAWLTSLFFLVPLAGIFFAMVPVYAHEVLDVGPAGLGLLMGSYGAGTVVGSAYLVLTGQMRRRGLRVTAVGVLFSAGVIAFAVSPSFLFSVIVAFCIGVTAMLWLNTLTAMVQTAAAPEMRGRAMSVGTTGMQLMTAGWLVAGAMSSMFGPVATTAFAGAAFAVLSLVVFVKSPDVRSID
jgi:MFS family permease